MAVPVSYETNNLDIEVVVYQGLYVNPSTHDEGYIPLKVDADGYIITTTDETS